MNRRARVPFALIGVLLLAGSGTIALSVHEPAGVEPAVDAGMERLAAESHTALRAAARAAAHEAAARPVVAPANSTVGDALNASSPFEDALRVRIYLAVSDRLERLATRRRGVNLSASLPPIRGEEELRAAIERVHLERVGPDGRSMAVGVRGVTLRARRGGRLVGETELSPKLVVESPVLAVHDRVKGFERRLNAPVGRPGLATRLSAVLYPVAWARGYAQFRGQPIENVVANRHVALATNGAVLAEQRVSFGASDAVGREVYRRTLLETGVTDLLRATNVSVVDRLERVGSTLGVGDAVPGTVDQLEPGDGTPRPADPIAVDVGRTADLAYVRAVRSLDEPIGATYSPTGRVRASVRTIRRERIDTHDPPDIAGGLIGESTSYDTTVRNGTETIPEAAAGWHEVGSFDRRVVVVERTTREWSKPGNDTAFTSGAVRIVRDVGLLVAANHTVGPAPDRPIRTVHRRGGPLDGPNLADAPELIRDRLVTRRGGPDGLAARAAIGRLDTDPRAVSADRPAEIGDWVVPNLSALHDEVRNISIEVPRGEVATFQANPPAMLAAKVRARRASLVDAPRSYGSVAERARVAVRAAYVDRVLEMLDARAAQARAGRDGLREALPTDDPGSLLREGYGARMSPMGAVGGPSLRATVDASPSYLTVEAVGHETVPAIPPGTREHPLAVRNLNAFSLPTTDVVEALFGLLSGPDKTSLRSAAQVLEVAVDRGLPTDAPGPPAGVLRVEVGASAGRIEAALVGVLSRNDVGSKSGRRQLVQGAIQRWDGPGARAAALANGSVAETVADRAIDRWPGELESAHARKRLRIGLDFAVEAARSDERFQPRRRSVERAAGQLRGVLGAVETGAERVTDRARGEAKALAMERAAALAAQLPRGVPVVPAPGMWYAMVNAWHVQTRGSYARFVVRVPDGAPDRMPPDLSYVREAAPVCLDVDGDGSQERLGENRRIEFAAETVVAVAVPPKPRGVGDVTARDERSAGWPEPGPAK